MIQTLSLGQRSFTFVFKIIKMKSLDFAAPAE